MPGYTIIPNDYLTAWRKEFSPTHRSILMYLWQRANHEEKTVKLENWDRPLTIRRGQVYESIRFIAAACGVSRNLGHSTLKCRGIDAYLSRKTVQGRTLITFHNYNELTDIKNFKVADDGTVLKRKCRRNLTKVKKKNKNSFSEEKNSFLLDGKKNSSIKKSKSPNIVLEKIAEKIEEGKKLTTGENEILTQYRNCRKNVPTEDREIIIDRLEAILAKTDGPGFGE